MSRFLRFTLYTTPQQATTYVLREAEVEDIEGILAGRPSDCFLVHEAFAVTASDTVEATLVAHQRRTAEMALRENNMAVCFFHNAMQLPCLSDEGYLLNGARAPLSAKELELVLSQLAGHPAYKSQTVSTTSEDGATVRLVRGVVAVSRTRRQTRGNHPDNDGT